MELERGDDEASVLMDLDYFMAMRSRQSISWKVRSLARNWGWSNKS